MQIGRTGDICWKVVRVLPRNSRIYGRKVAWSGPNIVRDLYNARKFGPLLFAGEQVSFFGAGEAALRTQAKLTDIQIACGAIDATLDFVFGFQLAGFGGNQPEDDDLSFGHEPQGLESAGAFAIELHEIAVRSDAVEEQLGHWLIAALGDPTGAEIAAAQMHGDGHAGRAAGDGGVNHLRIGIG